METRQHVLQEAEKPCLRRGFSFFISLDSPSSFAAPTADPFLQRRIERIVTRFVVHSCKGTLSLDARLWI